MKTRLIPLVAALALAIGSATLFAPSASAAPGDPLGTVPRLIVTTPDQSAVIESPGGTQTLTTTFSTSKVLPTTDIVFVLDATSSMAPNLAAMADGLADFVQQLYDNGATNLAFGVYFFGDVAANTEGEWALQLTPLSDSFTVDDVASVLRDPPAYSGGGDGPEDSILAGATVAASAGWRDGAQREEILITDAASHVRTCPDYCVNGEAATLANFQSIASANDVNVTVIPTGFYDSGTTQSTDVTLANLAAAFGDPPNRVTTDTGYLNLLDQKVIENPTNETAITVVPSGISITYADGTTSTDVTASLSKTASSDVTSDVSASYTLTATAAAAGAIQRPGATTTVEVDYSVGDTVVARQVITFTAPIQTVNVIYVDDDNNEVQVTPAAGAVTSLTGVDGQPVGYTEQDAIDGVPDGYVYKSYVDVPTYDINATDNQTQTIVVHLGHRHTTSTLTTTQTITYEGPTGYTIPGPNTQTITWTVDTDEATGVSTYTSTEGYQSVETPTVVGLIPDTALVPGTEATQQTDTPVDTQIVVTYTPLQTVNVVYVDDDNGGATVTPNAGTTTTLSGPDGTSVGFTEGQAEGGVPSGYVYKSTDNVTTYDTDSSVDQTIVVHLGHRHTTSTLDTTQTITYVGPDGYTIPGPNTQTITWTVDTDEVTGVSTYTSSQGYDAVDTPSVLGLTPDTDAVSATPAATQTNKPVDTQIVVTYTEELAPTISAGPSTEPPSTQPPSTQSPSTQSPTQAPSSPAPSIKAGPGAQTGGASLAGTSGFGAIAVLLVALVVVGFIIVRTRKIGIES